MKKVTLWFFIAAMGLLVACLPDSQETNNTTNTTEADHNAKPANSSFKTFKAKTVDLAPYQVSIQKMIGHPNGVVRNVNFGDSDEMVRKKENANLVEAKSNTLLYDIDLDDKQEEFIDIAYTFTGSNALKNIKIDTFTKNAGNAITIYKELQQYLIERYGVTPSQIEKGFLAQTQERIYLVKANLLQSDKDTGISLIYQER